MTNSFKLSLLTLGMLLVPVQSHAMVPLLSAISAATFAAAGYIKKAEQARILKEYDAEYENAKTLELYRLNIPSTLQNTFHSALHSSCDETAINLRKDYAQCLTQHDDCHIQLAQFLKAQAECAGDLCRAENHRTYCTRDPRTRTDSSSYGREHRRIRTHSSSYDREYPRTSPDFSPVMYSHCFKMNAAERAQFQINLGRRIISESL